MINNIKHSLNNGALILIPAFVAQDIGKEVEHECLFGREFETEGADGVNDNNFEFVRNFAHETRDLLHETVDAGFGTRLFGFFFNVALKFQLLKEDFPTKKDYDYYLQKSRNSKCRDATIRICDEIFHIKVTRSHGARVSHGQLVKSTNSGETECGFVIDQHKLKGWNQNQNRIISLVWKRVSFSKKLKRNSNLEPPERG
jgi:hypothetical protein